MVLNIPVCVRRDYLTNGEWAIVNGEWTMVNKNNEALMTLPCKINYRLFIFIIVNNQLQTANPNWPLA